MSESVITLGPLRGRDGSAHATGTHPDRGGIPWNKAVEMLNVDLDDRGFARKRPGSDPLGITFSSGGPFVGTMRAMFRTANGGLIGVDSTGQIAKLPLGASQWTEITVTDAITSPGSATIRFAQMRSGKIIIAYPNSAGRLHVLETLTLRRAGMGTPAAPTVADSAVGGAYAAVLRYYRVRMGVLSGSTVQRMGEAGASQSFTPNGAFDAAVVTKPATVEDATHWRVEVSLDNSVWYILSAWIVVATTTYNDSAVTTTYSTNDAAPLAGRYTNWTDVDYITTDENRLIGATVEGQIFYSPVRGSTTDDFLDEEFVPNTVEAKNWIWVDDEGSELTGISEPVLGSIWFGRLDALGRLISTQINTAPYRVEWILRNVYLGPVRQETMFSGVDESGAAALYWMSQHGPYRFSTAGIQYLGTDLLDLWERSNRMVSVTPAVTAEKPFGLFMTGRSRAMWWVNADVAASKTVLCLVFRPQFGRVERPGIVRDGWTVYDGDFGAGTAAVAFGDGTFGASGQTVLLPLVARAGTLKLLFLRDPDVFQPATTDDDDGTAFQGLVTLPDRHYGGHQYASRVRGASVLGTTGPQTLRLTLRPDYGAVASRTSDVTMTAAASESRTRRSFEDAAMDDMTGAIRVSIGDSAASTQTWEIDEVALRIERGAELIP